MSQASDASSKSGPDWTKAVTAMAALLGATATFLTAMRTLGVIGGVAPKTTPTPLVTSVSVATPTAELWSFEDDFGAPASGWESGTDADAEWGYQGGEYRMLVIAPDTTVWANMRQRRNLSNVVLSVEARAVAGPFDNQYGVILRYRDRSNFYLFSVSSDGMYAGKCWLMTNGKISSSGRRHPPSVKDEPPTCYVWKPEARSLLSS